MLGEVWCIVHDIELDFIDLFINISRFINKAPTITQIGTSGSTSRDILLETDDFLWNANLKWFYAFEVFFFCRKTCAKSF